ncbi:AAA family ATPase [Planktothrix agardhii]|uniref:AAA family ATPase n=1 Tax=Planktothrix agardhii TaxID=1160 RepID=UPI0028B19CF3|nr:ATP-binding protein [Planktothrix agardhii]
MSSTQKPIPRLDLAPKLNRPLSLFNPLDYLRLLYWAFFFPQAIEWYIQKYSNKNINIEKPTLINVLKQKYHQNPILLRLSVQSTLLLLIFAVIVNETCYYIGIKNHELVILFYSLLCLSLIWFIDVALGLNHGVIFNLLLLSEPSAITVIALTAIILSFKLYPLLHKSGIVIQLIRGLGFGLWISLGFILLFILVRFTPEIPLPFSIIREPRNSHPDIDIIFNIIKYIIYILPKNILYQVKMNVSFNTLLFTILLFLYSLSSFMTALFIVSRPDIWLIGSLLNLISIQNSSWLFPHITAIPIPLLSIRLKNWLKKNWQQGLYNANELLRYSYQFIPVVKAVNQVLAKTPSEYLIFRVSQLAEHPFDWNLVKFASASLSQEFKFQLIEGFFFWHELKLKEQPRLDTPAHAAAAGFWYLHEKQPEKATEAFGVVSSLLYGQEMLTLAQILAIFNIAKNLNVIAILKIPDFPPEPYLRPQTWIAIKGLYRVVEDTNLIKNSASRSTRSLALNRALGEIKGILDQSKYLPEAERDLIIDIAQNWQSALLGITEEVGKISITEKVINPYIIGDPVIGKQFIGRKDIINRLEELWVSTPQLQSVVLFGHRRMGKTSILRNISTRLDEKVKLVYVNLLTVGNSIQGVGEVLMAIADSLSDTLQIPPPDDESLINLPYRTFERYLKQIETQLGDTGLIIALDEFEQIEELIKSDRIPKDFMGVLRGMVQMSPKIAFALAGLHTLEEMTEDYFNPFFASIIPIRVSFLERATCRYLLANPGEDFPLDYKPDALDYIYDLTAGQPYLVQLIGFLLVRRYNDQVFELGNKRDPMFTIADVDGIINQPEFYQNGRYYFTGVWQQAGEGSPGQQNIIKAIAPHPTGLDFNTLQTITNLDPNSLQNALDTLSRHDVIIETDNHWRIIVELFRRWVINSVKLNLLT